jgi:hypothetical protein
MIAASQPFAEMAWFGLLELTWGDNHETDAFHPDSCGIDRNEFCYGRPAGAQSDCSPGRVSTSGSNVLHLH